MGITKINIARPIGIIASHIFVGLIANIKQNTIAIMSKVDRKMSRNLSFLLALFLWSKNRIPLRNVNPKKNKEVNPRGITANQLVYRKMLFMILNVLQGRGHRGREGSYPPTPRTSSRCPSWTNPGLPQRDGCADAE